METKTTTNHAQGHNANIVLAVSGQPFPSIEEVIKTLDLAQCEIRAFYKRFNYKDSNVLRQIDTVHEALKAASASGAVDTVATGGNEKCTCPDDQCLLGDHPICRWKEYYARKSSEGQP